MQQPQCCQNCVRTPRLAASRVNNKSIPTRSSLLYYTMGRHIGLSPCRVLLWPSMRCNHTPLPYAEVVKSLFTRHLPGQRKKDNVSAPSHGSKCFPSMSITVPFFTTSLDTHAPDRCDCRREGRESRTRPVRGSSVTGQVPSRMAALGTVLVRLGSRCQAK